MDEKQAAKNYFKFPNHIKDFISLIESYYAPYASDIVRFFIAMDLTKFTEDQLRELFDLVRHHYTRNYKNPPDTRILMEAWENKFKQSGLRKTGNHFEDKNGNVFDLNMVKIGHYDGDRFIPLLTEEKLRLKIIGMGAAKISPDMLIEYKEVKE